LAFNLPPTNHWAKGLSHTRASLQGLYHSRALAHCSQNTMRLALACSYMALFLTLARFLKIWEGSNVRVSCKRSSTSVFNWSMSYLLYWAMTSLNLGWSALWSNSVAAISTDVTTIPSMRIRATAMSLLDCVREETASAATKT